MRYDPKIWEYEFADRTWKFMDNKQSATALFICEEILLRDVYRLNSLQISDTDEVLDVGANIGIFANVVHRKFGCRVTSFEPMYESYTYSIFNCGLNNAKDGYIQIYNQAISKQGVDNLTINYIADAPGNSGRYETQGKPQTVPATSLLPFITKKTKMIKIDTEGEEYEILPEILPAIQHVEYLAVEAHVVPGNPGAQQRLLELVQKSYPGKLIWMQTQ